MNRARIVGAASAALGLIGLGLTLLPVITVSMSGRMLLMLNSGRIWQMLEAGSPDAYWEQYCQLYSHKCDDPGTAYLDFNVYDLLTSGYAATALIPIVLALAVAVGGLTAWRDSDPRVFTFMSLASAAALFALAFTALNPAVALSGSGQFSKLQDTADSTGASDGGLSVGPGLYLPAVVLTIVFLLNAWPAVTALVERRRSPVPAFA